MDIYALKPIDEAQSCVIKHPVTGEDTDIVIKLLGADSKEWKKAVQAINKKRLANGNRGISDEEKETLPFVMLASVTVGWENLQEGGKDVKFSHDEAVRIYKEIPIIAEQVDKFVGERTNFLPQFETI